VVDGDTLDVLHNGRGERIRLYGVGAPEKGKPYGKNAKQALSALAFGKTLTVRPDGTTTYDRTVARVAMGGRRDLGAELVGQGWAWWSPEYASTDTLLPELQARARAERCGLWADPAPQPPWEFRHPDWQKIIDEAGQGDETRGIVWVAPTGTRYHRETCSTLHGGGTEISRSVAEAKSYTPCSVCRP